MMLREDSFSKKWPVVSLSDVVEFLDSRRKPVKASERVEGDYAYYGANGLQGSIDNYIFDEPLVLLAEDGGHFGNPERDIAYIATGKYWVNNHAHVLKPKEGVDLSFLFRVLQRYDVSPFIKGATRAKLTKGDASRIPFPLPPLAEQKRIAAILDKADAIRQKRQQAIKLADEFLRSVFLDMFGDPVTNPKGWVVKPVGELVKCIVPGRDKPKSFTGEMPWITTNDLQHLGTTTKSDKRIGLSDEEISAVKARIIPKGSVLMTCVGDLGIISLAGNDLVMNQQLHAFLTSEYFEQEFLMFALSFQKHYMLKMASSTTVPYMNKTVCNSVPVIVPALKLQQQFKKIYLNTVCTIEKYQSASCEKLSLFNSLSQKTFSGHL